MTNISALQKAQEWKTEKVNFESLLTPFVTFTILLWFFLSVIGSDEMVKNDQQKEHNTHEVRKHSQLYICDHFEGIE